MSSAKESEQTVQEVNKTNQVAIRYKDDLQTIGGNMASMQTTTPDTEMTSKGMKELASVSSVLWMSEISVLWEYEANLEKGR